MVIVSCSGTDNHKESVHPSSENFLSQDLIDEYIKVQPDSVLIDSSLLTSSKWIGDNNENILGNVIAAKVIDSSSIVILDHSQSQLKIFDAETGELKNSFARKGRGPGELLQPSDMDVSGDLILVVDRFMKLDLYKNVNDSIRFINQITLEYSPNKICALDNFIFVSGIDLESSNTIFKYDLKSLKSMGSFHKTYKSDNPLVRTMLSNNLISCNRTTNQILVVSPYLPYVYAYNIDGKINWISEIENFNPMIAKEGMRDDGRSSLTKSLNSEGFSDRYISFLEQSNSDFNFLQIARTEKQGDENIGGSVLTYKIDVSTGSGNLISKDLNRMLDYSGNYIIVPINDEYPTVKLLDNPFNEY
jgi:hypothetical protein